MCSILQSKEASDNISSDSPNAVPHLARDGEIGEKQGFSLHAERCGSDCEL